MFGWIRKFKELPTQLKIFIITVIVMFLALALLSIHPYIRIQTHRTGPNTQGLNHVP